MARFTICPVCRAKLARPASICPSSGPGRLVRSVFSSWRFLSVLSCSRSTFSARADFDSFPAEVGERFEAAARPALGASAPRNAACNRLPCIAREGSELFSFHSQPSHSRHLSRTSLWPHSAPSLFSTWLCSRDSRRDQRRAAWLGRLSQNPNRC
jgi:hypothetical protein